MHLLFLHAKIANRLFERAQEVVYEECMDSQVLPVDVDSYKVWAKRDYWMVPWVEILNEWHSSKK